MDFSITNPPQSPFSKGGSPFHPNNPNNKYSPRLAPSNFGIEDYLTVYTVWDIITPMSENAMNTEDGKGKAPPNDYGKNVLFAHQIACRKIDIQNQSHNSLETKLGVLFGFSSLLIVTLVLKINASPDLLSSILFLGGVLANIVALALLAWALRSKTYLNPLSRKIFYTEDACGKNEIEYIDQAVADIFYCFEENEKKQAQKGKLFNLAIYALLLGVVMLTLNFYKGVMMEEISRKPLSLAPKPPSSEPGTGGTKGPTPPIIKPVPNK